MEFLDDESRPRFVFQSQSASPPSQSETWGNPSIPSRVFLTISLSVALSLFSLSVFYLQSEPFKSLVLWISLSLLIGPFAPSSLTGGRTRVGHGRIIEPERESVVTDSEPKKKPISKRSKSHRVDFPPEKAVQSGVDENGLLRSEGKSESALITEGESVIKVVQNGNSRIGDDASNVNGEEREWNDEDIEILKKQIAKNPAGKPGRWEAIAGAFNGRHKVESVIKRAKELGEKKMSGGDDYAQFLKNRKQLDAGLIEDKSESSAEANGERKKESGMAVWSSAEDIALLNALKAFPKEVPMRWEKIAVAVPGKSKAACMKRISELKRDFRSSKAGSES